MVESASNILKLQESTPILNCAVCTIRLLKHATSRGSRALGLGHYVDVSRIPPDRLVGQKSSIHRPFADHWVTVIMDSWVD